MDTSMTHLDAMIREGYRTTFKAAYLQTDHVKVTESTQDHEENESDRLLIPGRVVATVKRDIHTVTDPAHAVDGRVPAEFTDVIY